MVVEEIGIGVLVTREKGFGALFLEGGSAGAGEGESGFFFELLERGVLSVEEEGCEEREADG